MRLILASLLLASLWLTGCQANDGALPSAAGSGSPAAPGDPAKPFDPAGVPEPSPRVDTMELDSFPVAENLDGKPGVDGVKARLRLYNYDPSQTQAVALKSGVVEFLIFEGKVRDTLLGEAQPHHIWRFHAREMGGMGRKVIVGWQYELALNWQDRAPKSDTFTLTARLLRPGTRPLYARPVYLTVGVR